MSLEKIVEKILADGRAEAEKILADAHRKAEEVKATAEEESNRLAAILLRNAEREGGLEAGRVLTQARLEKRLKVLRRKKELVAEVLEKALAESTLAHKGLKKKVVSQEGEREENLDRGRFVDDLRGKLEKFILEALKI